LNSDQPPFPGFLPDEVNELTEPASIAFAQQIQRHSILTAFDHSPPLAIATSTVHQGNGNPVVLLHGFDSSVLEFRLLLPLLAAEHETWAIDLLGFGFTEFIDGVPIQPSTIRQHLHSTWQTLIAQPITLVGVSMGGAVAIDFARFYPDCISRLVLVNSVGFSGSFPIGRLLFPPVEAWAAEWLRFRKRTALNAIASVPFADPALVDAIRCALLHQEMPGWASATIAFTKSGGYSEITPYISEVSQSTLIVWGETDDVLGTADATRFQQAIAGSQLVWIRSGHAPQLEQPQLLAHYILKFCQS
jgi:pimeloyl-ACP methyl ester carboxylesterase